MLNLNKQIFLKQGKFDKINFYENINGNCNIQKNINDIVVFNSKEPCVENNENTNVTYNSFITYFEYIKKNKFKDKLNLMLLN